MKARDRLLSVFLCLAAAIGLSAQSRTPSGPNPAVAPTEPEIIMPQVILQIEDLSVEKVEAQLPPEEDLLAPERKIPLLSEGDLPIGEPSIPAPGPEVEPAVGKQGDRLLSADINLGAGSPNRIVGSISLKTLGQDPRFSLLFNHETLDGFAGNPSGAGFNLRNDVLDGALKFRLGGVDTELGGRFSDNETGLQGQSPLFTARLGRTLDGTAAFSAVPLDWLTLRAGASGDADWLTLQGAPPPGTPPQQLAGARVAPSVSAEARFGAMKIGLETLYTFRVDPETDQAPGGSLHRFRATASFGADLSTAFTFDASAGWFVNSAGLSRFPFSATVTATPFEFVTFTVGGGYKVTPYDMHDVMSIHPLVLPNSITDDSGWFGDASVQFTFARELSASMVATFMASDAMPVGDSNQYFGTTGNGLFPVTQKRGTHLSTKAGMRWGITQSFSLSGSWTHEFLDRLFFTPIDSLEAELVALEPSGRFGGTVSVAVAPTFTGVLQQPVLRVSTFAKVSDAVKLQLVGDDLLGLLPGDPRLDIAPYVAPGFRVTGSLSISL
ncbi:MAG: hypothetical protein ABSB63_06775 [Spirochaetia bacterium]